MKILELADMLRIEMNLKAALCTLERVERLTRNAFGTSMLHGTLVREVNTLRWALKRHQAPDVKYRNPPKTPKAWKLGWPVPMAKWRRWQSQEENLSNGDGGPDPRSDGLIYD